MSNIAALIPNYNNDKYVQEAIDSCIKQTVDVDIVVVDDGSTDNSLDILKKNGNNLKFMIVKENGGPSSARNTGVEWILGEGSYDYILLLDSDDYIYEDFVETCLKVFEYDEEIIGVYCDYDILVNEEGVEPFKVREYKRSFNLEDLWEQCLIPHLALIKTSAFLKVLETTGGLYDTRLRVCNDYDMDLKLAQHGVLWHHPEVKAVVREGVNNSCTPIQGQVRQDCMNLLRQTNHSFYV